MLQAANKQPRRVYCHGAIVIVCEVQFFSEVKKS